MTDPARELAQRAVAELRARQPLPPLCPAAPWNRELSSRIAAAGLPPAVAGALLLWNDDLEASHALSQGLPDRLGSWLHGAMHRREGDYSNSKYWFRKVGAHAGYARMAQRAHEVAETTTGCIQPAALEALAKQWDPFVFVDLCAFAGHVRVAAQVLERLQAAELELLTELALTPG